MITADTLTLLRAVQEGLLPDTVEALAEGGVENELGEETPSYTATGATFPGRLGDENGGSRFLARPVDSEDLVLTVPATAAADAPAFRVNGAVVVERSGPDRNALNSIRTVRRIPVRRTSPGTAEADEEAGS